METLPDSLRIPILSLKEILILVFVIVILVVICFPPGRSMALARRLKDTSLALQIKTAVINYQTEYGALPIPAGAVATKDDLVIGAPPGENPGAAPTAGMIAFYQGLCGNINAYTGSSTLRAGFNPKNIPYLNVQKSSADANGVIIQYFDAYGYNGRSTAPSPNYFIYFSVKLDSNYDNIISELPDPTYATDGGTPFGAEAQESCAVWCNNDQPYDKPTPRWSKTY